MSILDRFIERIPKIISQCRQYKHKIEDLFYSRESQTISLKHMGKFIIINPKALFNLIQSNYLATKKHQNWAIYFNLKTEILNLILYFISEFPLNARIIYEDAFLVVQNNQRINFITYLIQDVRQAFSCQLKSNAQQQKVIFKNYHEVSTRIFYSFCSICVLKTSELKLITNSLTDFYYEEQLYTNLIVRCFELLSNGLQNRQIRPQIFCSNRTQNEGIRLLFKNSKWQFESGMTVFMWIDPQNCTDFQLIRVKSIDDESMIIRVQGQRLIIISSTVQSQHQEEVVQEINLPNNKESIIGIELQPASEGLFMSNFYKLNIRINEKEYLNVGTKIPKFQQCLFVAEYSLLNSFIGKIYSIIISKIGELSKYEQICKFQKYGPCKEAQVIQLLAQNIFDEDELVCIFNTGRIFEGLLINYIENGHFGNFQGRVFQCNYHQYNEKLIEIYLPFLYFMNLVKEQDEPWNKYFNTILNRIITIITKNNYEIEQVMFLLYFLQTNRYRISQQNLNLLYQHQNEHENYYLSIVTKYFDLHTMIGNGLQVDQNMQTFQNPVEKNILLFHLQTLWKDKWNILQGFQGWWSPKFFHPQNNSKFNPKDFVYNQKKQARVQWSVLNLVTKDYCKCFLQPIFIHPKYAQCDYFQKEYVKKESFFEPFRLNLNKHKTYKKIVCKKVSKSKFDKLKQKFLGKKEESKDFPKKGQAKQIKQFESECLFIDILTVVQGNIAINKQGFIIFNSCHKNKDFGHMCAKAFHNQTFYYLNIPFVDIQQIYKKRFNASNNAVYIKTLDGKEMMFHFHLKNVDAFLALLQNHVKVKKDAFSNYVNSEEPVKWIDKFMSNYEYLQWLNQIAGRNYNDITQYPVLPWVHISDDIPPSEANSKSYRNLNKNIGSHGNEERIRNFIQKYENNNDEQLFNEYHFGTHYSSSAIIFNFLIRIRPYSIGALTLQSGKFDCADRIFYSFCGSWKNATTSTTDIRELIPQIYTLPEMFINKNNYFYGLTQDKIEVDNAILPQWANGNPFVFVAEQRKQLESRYVSQNINNWIDLIYGYKQRGKDAVQHMNIFYPLTYENCIDLDQVGQRQERISFETQIAHFGQNPSQIIGNNPHPTRKTKKSQWQEKLVGDGAQLLIQTCFLAKLSTRQQKILYKSVLQGVNSVMTVKFISTDTFFVLRKSEYYLFKIINKKTNFISKQLQVEYELQNQQTRLNIKQLAAFMPVTSINYEIVVLGGFYSGYCQIIFLKQPKYNCSFKFEQDTITALNYEPNFRLLFVGNTKGYLYVYKVCHLQKAIEFQFLRSIKAHDSKINDISINTKANIVITCSQDGVLNLYNLYSQTILRTFYHPNRLPVHFAHITTNPLYAVVFYSKENSTVYVYSINGQFLDSVIQKSGFIYSLNVLKATDSTESLVYLNSQRELFVWELPFLRLKRKVKMRKDENKISCFDASNNGKVLVTGTEDGLLQIISNPESY